MSKAQRAPFPSTRGAAFGPLEQVFDDVWWAWGTTRMAPGITIPRNMVVVREPEGLVVIHPVMLPDAEQRRLEALGPVKHLVRLGDFHGMDDALWVSRYGAKLWAPAGATSQGVRVDVEMTAATEPPLADASLFAFETSRAPELVLHLRRHGGVLVTCDAVQRWDPLPDGCSRLWRWMSGPMGFRGRACIGPGWRRAAEPKDGVGFGPSFRALLERDFRHVVSAHGRPLLDTARDDLRRAVTALYG